LGQRQSGKIQKKEKSARKGQADTKRVATAYAILAEKGQSVRGEHRMQMGKSGSSTMQKKGKINSGGKEGEDISQGERLI